MTATGIVVLSDRGWREAGAVTSSSSATAFAGFRFPPEVISVAVRWYLRYGLSYRDVEELLAKRGVEVDHVTVYRWVQRFTTEFVSAARPLRHVPGHRWFVARDLRQGRRPMDIPVPGYRSVRTGRRRVVVFSA